MTEDWMDRCAAYYQHDKGRPPSALEIMAWREAETNRTDRDGE